MPNLNLINNMKGIPPIVWLSMIGVVAYAFGYFWGSQGIASMGMIMIGLGFFITVLNVAMILRDKYIGY